MAKKSAGRPTIAIDLAKVESFASRGLSDEQIALALGISYSTLQRRKKEFEDFGEAIKRGQAKGVAAVSNALFESAKAGNTTAQIFFLKCRAGWKETERIEHTGADGAPIQTEEVGSGLASMYAALQKKAAKNGQPDS